MQLKDKVAFITGGASGLGRATAENFIHAGAKVILFDLNEENAASLLTKSNPISFMDFQGEAIERTLERLPNDKSLIEVDSIISDLDLIEVHEIHQNPKNMVQINNIW